MCVCEWVWEGSDICPGGIQMCYMMSTAVPRAWEMPRLVGPLPRWPVSESCVKVEPQKE